LFKAILRFIAVMLLALFVIAFPLSLVLRDVGSLLFNPETTKALVGQNLRGSELMASLARQATQQLLLTEGPENGTANPAQLALSQLSDEHWKQITELIAPESLVEETADQVVDAFSIWLNTQAAFPEVQINLTALKDNAIANAGEVVTVVMNGLPACDADSLAALNFTEGAESLVASIPLCLPPEPVYSLVIASAELSMTQMLDNAPDTIDLGQLNQGQAPAELTQLKQNLVSMRTFLNWSWLAVAIIGLIGVAMGGSGIASYLRWASWPLALAGVVVLIFGIGLQLFSLNFLDQFLGAVLEQGPGAMGSLGTAIASGALNLITQPLLLQGLVITVIGTTALIYSRILARQQASPGIPINRRKIGL
jgi:hypothetical protein